MEGTRGRLTQLVKRPRRTLLYSLSGFPIVSAPLNFMLNDQKNAAAFGMELFIQNKVKNVLNAAGQIGSTQSLEGAGRATWFW